jgi:hypothetical protein
MMAFGGILSEGFLLGAAFLIGANKINIKYYVKINKSLQISGIGIIVLFVSFFSNPSSGSYLPFGLVASSFFLLGSYLFLMGIFSSAIGISSDNRIRNAIRSSLKDHSNLLHNIAMADINRDLESNIDNVMNNHKEELANLIESNNVFSEEELKKYVMETIQEFKGQRK